MNTTIGFPNLGYEVNVGKNISVFGIQIAYYGIIIACAMVIGTFVAYHEAKRTKQNPDNYIDFILWMAIPAVLGARLYYVIFEWKYYSNNLDKIFNIRGGGLAIYGGVIAAVITLIIFAKRKRLNILQMLDTAVLGLVIGQCIGRWGNFFNREAYGGFSDGLFAMQIPLTEASTYVEDAVVSVGNTWYLQVQPTFLYESFGCLCIFIFLMILKKHKKFHGELIAFYMTLYGALRFVIEGFRTDQLTIGEMAVSQIFSAIIVVVGIGYIIFAFIHERKENKKVTINEAAEATREFFDEEETLEEQEHNI